MALVNYATREINAKIVYYGPGLSGKTTNIQHVFSKVQPKNKGKLISLSTQGDRTLFFDFLPVELGSIKGFRTRFHLYTVPGQVFYNSTRKMVLKGADGVVFVADSQPQMMDENIQSFENLKVNLSDMGINIETFPVVLQYNKRDLPNAATIDDINARLNSLDKPWFEASAMTGEGVLKTLTAIVKYVLHELKQLPNAHNVDFESLDKTGVAVPNGPVAAMPEVVKPVLPIPIPPLPVAPLEVKAVAPPPPVAEPEIKPVEVTPPALEVKPLAPAPPPPPMAEPAPVNVDDTISLPKFEFKPSGVDVNVDDAISSPTFDVKPSIDKINIEDTISLPRFKFEAEERVSGPVVMEPPFGDEPKFGAVEEAEDAGFPFVSAELFGAIKPPDGHITEAHDDDVLDAVEAPDELGEAITHDEPRITATRADWPEVDIKSFTPEEVSVFSEAANEAPPATAIPHFDDSRVTPTEVVRLEPLGMGPDVEDEVWARGLAEAVIKPSATAEPVRRDPETPAQFTSQSFVLPLRVDTGYGIREFAVKINVEIELMGGGARADAGSASLIPAVPDPPRTDIPAIELMPEKGKPPQPERVMQPPSPASKPRPPEAKVSVFQKILGMK